MFSVISGVICDLGTSKILVRGFCLAVAGEENDESDRIENKP